MFRCLWKAQMSTVPGAGITGHCELPHMDAGTKPGFSQEQYTLLTAESYILSEISILNLIYYHMKNRPINNNPKFQGKHSKTR